MNRSNKKISFPASSAAKNYDEIDSLIQENVFSRGEKLSSERNRIKEKFPFRITERFE